MWTRRLRSKPNSDAYSNASNQPDSNRDSSSESNPNANCYGGTKSDSNTNRYTCGEFDSDAYSNADTERTVIFERDCLKRTRRPLRYPSDRRNIFTAVSQYTRHPN